MSLVEIYLPQAVFVFSIQCVTKRSRLRVLLHFADKRYNFGVFVSKRSQGASRRALNKLRFPRQSVRSMRCAEITSYKPNCRYRFTLATFGLLSDCRPLDQKPVFWFPERHFFLETEILRMGWSPVYRCGLRFEGSPTTSGPIISPSSLKGRVALYRVHWFLPDCSRRKLWRSCSLPRKIIILTAESRLFSACAISE